MLAARPAAAQTAPGWDLFAGYTFDRDVADDVNLAEGWAATAARSVNGWLSIAVDVSGARTTVAATGTEIALASLTAAAGARAAARVGPFLEFGEVLAGVTRATGTAFGVTSATRHGVLQAGVGVDYPAGRRLAARAHFDVRVSSIGHDYRVAGGLVVRTR